MAIVSFFCQDVAYHPPHSKKIARWLTRVALEEGQKLEQIDCIFCSDEFLLGLNQQYLQHDFYTDIITFDYTDKLRGGIRGDLFISLERARANAASFEVSETDEIHRLLVHGVLHLLGFGDKTASEQAQMRAKEDLYLSLLPALKG